MLSKYFGVIKEVLAKIEDHYIKADFIKAKFFSILSIVLSAALPVSVVIWGAVVSENILLCILVAICLFAMFPWILWFGCYLYGAIFVRLFELLLEPLFKKRPKIGITIAYFLGVVVATAFLALSIWLVD